MDPFVLFIDARNRILESTSIDDKGESLGGGNHYLSPNFTVRYWRNQRVAFEDELINKFAHMLEESIIMSLIVDSVEKSTLWSSGDQWLTVIKKLSHYETETRDKTKPNMTTIKLDRLIVLSKSSLLVWFLQVSLIVIIKGRSPMEVSLIVIIKQV